MTLPIEKQVCSLELAKRLKELGLKQESHWCWTNAHKEYYCGYEDYYIKDEIYLIDEKPYPPNVANYAKKRVEEEFYLQLKVYSAFTVAELGEMLPEGFNSYRQAVYEGVKWFVSPPYAFSGTVTNANIEADARAEMLIYLIENNLLPLIEANLNIPKK